MGTSNDADSRKSRDPITPAWHPFFYDADRSHVFFQGYIYPVSTLTVSGNTHRNESFVSVVIPTKNEVANIENCIRSIHRQTYASKRIEIIVVDNQSTDRTLELAKKLGARTLIWGPDRSAQRNFGGRWASGKYFLFLDADMILSESVVEECVDHCEKEEVIGLYIPEKIIKNNFWNRVRNFERSFYDATCIDGVRFIHRKEFLQINGFDENLISAEDWDLTRRLSELGKISIIDSPLYHNENCITVRKYLQKKAYYASLSHRYIQKWGKDDHLVHKQFGLTYRLFTVFFENGKWKKLISNPLLFVCVFLVKAMVGILFSVARLRCITQFETDFG